MCIYVSVNCRWNESCMYSPMSLFKEMTPAESQVGDVYQPYQMVGTGSCGYEGVVWIVPVLWK